MAVASGQISITENHFPEVEVIDYFINEHQTIRELFNPNRISRFRVTFQLTYHLSLNLSFHKIRFLNNLSVCGYNYLLLRSIKFYNSTTKVSDIFKYCGVQSQFDIFPSEKAIDIEVHVKNDLKHQLLINFTFQVLDGGIIFNVPTEGSTKINSVKKDKISLLYFNSLKVLESTFLLKVEKFNRIEITIYKRIIPTVIAYDGPNTESPKIKLKDTKGVINLKSSLFSCYVLVVQVKEHFPTLYFKTIPSNKRIKLVTVSANLGNTITLPNNYCTLFRGTMLCLIKLFATDLLHINLTKTEQNSGHVPCRNSDISIYDLKYMNGTIKYSELTSPCSKILFRSFYSSSSSILLAAQLGANTTITFTINCTTCLPLIFNPFMLLSKCYLGRDSIESPCVRKQFARGVLIPKDINHVRGWINKFKMKVKENECVVIQVAADYIRSENYLQIFRD